jgi:hypothetical protein
VFPYLSIRFAGKRCGKSRLLGLLARVAFNGDIVETRRRERGAAPIGRGRMMLVPWREG